MYLRSFYASHKTLVSPLKPEAIGRLTYSFKLTNVYASGYKVGAHLIFKENAFSLILFLNADGQKISPKSGYWFLETSTLLFFVLLKLCMEIGIFYNSQIHRVVQDLKIPRELVLNKRGAFRLIGYS